RLRVCAGIAAAIRHSDRASEKLRDLVERRRGRRRVWGHDGGADVRRGMPKMRGWNFDTPRNYRLLLAARLAEQVAIAAAHQSKTSLHQTDGPIPQIVSFPGPL